MVRHSARTLIFIAISVIAVLLLLKTVPTGFLPNEDQGYLMADVQLPEAASLNRTKEAIDRINSILRRNDNVQSVTSVAGFSSVGQPIAEQRPDFHPTERLEPAQDDGRADHDPAQRAALL